MTANQHEIERLIRAGRGVVARREHPELIDSLRHAVRRGQLKPVMPGVYAAADTDDDLGVRLRAAMMWDPNAVVTRRAAAKLTFWPQMSVTRIELAVNTRKGKHRNLVVVRRRIPPELVTEAQGIRMTSPALTALDLSATHGGNAIDTVLRTRAATLEQMHEALALTPSRRGNADRRRLLLDSRGKPWSEAERDLHRLLFENGIDGWEGNWGFPLLSGYYWIDVAFEKLKLAIEVDGWEFHGTPQAFESDRWRQNDLVLAGWRVLRFTAKMIRDNPQIVLRLIERALAA